MSKNPWVWIVLSALGFGGGFPVSKALLDSGITVWQLFVTRYVIAAAVIMVFVTRRGLDRVDPRRRGTILGIVNVAVPTVFLTFATDLLPASIAGILAAFIPITTIAFAHTVVPGERFVAVRMPGVIIALGGAGILLGGSRDPDGASLSILGLILGVIGVATAGLGGALNRRFAMKTPALDLAAPQFAASAIVLLVISTPFGGLELAKFDAIQWLGMVVMALISTALPFFGILKAAELASAATVSNVGYLVPLVAAIGSVIFLGDSVTVGFAVGGSAIVFGVWLSDRLARRRLAVK